MHTAFIGMIGIILIIVCIVVIGMQQRKEAFFNAQPPSNSIMNRSREASQAGRVTENTPTQNKVSLMTISSVMTTKPNEMIDITVLQEDLNRNGRLYAKNRNTKSFPDDNSFLEITPRVPTPSQQQNAIRFIREDANALNGYVVNNATRQPARESDFDTNPSMHLVPTTQRPPRKNKDIDLSSNQNEIKYFLLQNGFEYGINTNLEADSRLTPDIKKALDRDDGINVIAGRVKDINVCACNVTSQECVEVKDDLNNNAKDDEKNNSRQLRINEMKKLYKSQKGLDMTHIKFDKSC